MPVTEESFASHFQRLRCIFENIALEIKDNCMMRNILNNALN
jgi:hypothetical protein